MRTGTGFRLAFLMVAGLAATSAALAQDADGKLDFSNRKSKARTVAQRLLEKESGEKINGQDVSVAEIDLNQDGFNEIFAYGQSSYFCGTAGCSPRIYEEFEAGWYSILQDETGSTIGGPEAFTISARLRGGYFDILYGDFLFGWNGEAYAQVDGPPASELDTAGFMADCRQNRPVREALENAGEDVEQGLETFCSCLSGQVRTAGLQQHELDLFGKDLADSITQSDIEAYGETYEDFSAATREFTQTCMRQ